MGVDLDKKQFSEAMIKALDDLERIEFDFSIDEPEARAKKIEGRFVGYLRDRGETEN